MFKDNKTDNLTISQSYAIRPAYFLQTNKPQLFPENVLANLSEFEEENFDKNNKSSISEKNFNTTTELLSRPIEIESHATVPFTNRTCDPQNFQKSFRNLKSGKL